jgi:hypothetical protein
MKPSQKHVAAVANVLIALISTLNASTAAAQSVTPDSAQVALQASDISLDGRLTFSGNGFAGGESTSVTVEDGQGTVQAQLEGVHVEADGQVYTVSVPVPDGLAPGPHTLRVTGLTSGRFGRASFNLHWQTPNVHLVSYTGKPTNAVSFGGAGFVPGEAVDVFFGENTTAPLTTVTADAQGDINAQNVGIPFIDAGDYKVVFIGRTSQTPVSVGFNIQGFHPWVVLHNYYLAPQSSVGFTGEDFVPGEAVAVYLNSQASAPLMQVTADANGRFATDNASLPDLSGDNELIFVGQQSQTEVTATFSIAKD